MGCAVGDERGESMLSIYCTHRRAYHLGRGVKLHPFWSRPG